MRQKKALTIRNRLNTMNDWKPRKDKIFTSFTTKKQLLINSPTKHIPSWKSIDLPPWIGVFIDAFF